MALLKDSPATASAPRVDLGLTGAAHITEGLLVELSRFFSVDLKNEPSVLTLAQGLLVRWRAGPSACKLFCESIQEIVGSGRGAFGRSTSPERSVACQPS